MKNKKTAKKEPRHPSAYGLTHLHSCADLDKDIFVSLRRASIITGIGREPLRRMLREADCGPAARRGASPVWTMLDIFEVAQTPQRARANPDTLKPTDRLAHYTAERHKAALAERAASLVEADDFAATNRRIGSVLGRMIDEAQKGLSACGLSPEMITRLGAHFAATRAQVAEALGRM